MFLKNVYISNDNKFKSLKSFIPWNLIKKAKESGKELLNTASAYQIIEYFEETSIFSKNDILVTSITPEIKYIVFTANNLGLEQYKECLNNKCKQLNDVAQEKYLTSLGLDKQKMIEETIKRLSIKG